MSNGRENKGSPGQPAAAEPTRQANLPESATFPLEQDSATTRVAQRAKSIPPPCPPSYFAPVERAGAEELLHTIELVTQSPVTTALLRSATAMMCVLNEQRQIVTLNAAYLDGLNAANADDILGLRPGEAIKCTHCHDHPGGCGTGPHCCNCGAAIAIVASQRAGKPVQRECLLSIRDRKGKTRDLSFMVRASPFDLADQRFTVFNLNDISVQKLHAGLEHAFLHDLSNVVSALSASSEMLKTADVSEMGPILEDVYELTQRLSREVIVQRLLLSEEPTKHRQIWRSVRLADSAASLARFFSSHPMAISRRLVISTSLEVEECLTDASLLERVLINMLLNAFEATESGGEVRLNIESTTREVHFAVWNSACISETVAPRIFQRYFSTKKGLGRGQGTYAMRLLGEKLLHGRVDFSSSREEGTTFHLYLPISAKRSR